MPRFRRGTPFHFNCFLLKKTTGMESINQILDAKTVILRFPPQQTRRHYCDKVNVEGSVFAPARMLHGWLVSVCTGARSMWSIFKTATYVAYCRMPDQVYYDTRSNSARFVDQYGFNKLISVQRYMGTHAPDSSTRALY